MLVHGGDEYDTRVNDEQRGWGRWLVAHSASFIVGSHPHVVQREEILGGTRILHSLGNAVYPQRLKGADSGVLHLLEMGGVVTGNSRLNWAPSGHAN